MRAMSKPKMITCRKCGTVIPDTLKAIRREDAKPTGCYHRFSGPWTIEALERQEENP